MHPFQALHLLPLLMLPLAAASGLLSTSIGSSVGRIRTALSPEGSGHVLVRHAASVDLDDDALIEHVNSLAVELLEGKPQHGYQGGNVPGRGNLASHIRKVMGGPAHVFITGHAEASYLPEVPRWLLFGCITPAEAGGATPVYDIPAFESALKLLAPQLWSDVRAHGVQYIRNYPSRGTGREAVWLAAREVTASWQERFPGLERPTGQGEGDGLEQVRAQDARPGFAAEWVRVGGSGAAGAGNCGEEGVLGDRNDETLTLRTSWVQAGFAFSPDADQSNDPTTPGGTTEKQRREVWHNQLFAMHGRYWDAHGGFDSIPLDERPMHTRLGNGRELTAQEYRALEAAHAAARVKDFSWRRGDVLALDNFRYMHAREPFRGQRRHVVVLSDSVQPERPPLSPRAQAHADALLRPGGLSELGTATYESPSSTSSASSAYAQTGDSSNEPGEAALRRELALAYQYFAQAGLTELTYQHITCTVVGDKKSESGSGSADFLLQPYGIGWDEVTPRSLMKVRAEGGGSGDVTVIHPGDSEFAGELNPSAAFVHGVLHLHRPDARCIVHVHSPAISAVAALQEGFLPVDQSYYALAPLAYHGFEGLTNDPDETASLLADLSPDTRTLVLRNHGLVVLGRSLAEAVGITFYAQRAAEAQVAAMAAVGGRVTQLQLPHADTAAKAQAQWDAFPALYEGEWKYLQRATMRGIKARGGALADEWEG